ncbi:MAG: hypothetical protein QW516_01080 [Nitrososphaerota archaeon]
MANELELLRKGLSPLYAPSSDRMRIAIPDIAWGDSRERVLEFPDGWSVNVYRMRAYDERPINAEDIIRALRSPVGSSRCGGLRRAEKKSSWCLTIILGPRGLCR